MLGIWCTMACIRAINEMSKLQLINLISGYNRDLQLTKEPLVNSFETALSSISIMNLVVKGLKASKESCIKAFDNGIFAADEAIELVKKGIPFREAYKKVAENMNKVKKINPEANILSKKHIGATGNLGLKKLISHLNSIKALLSKQENEFNAKIKNLII